MSTDGRRRRGRKRRSLVQSIGARLSDSVVTVRRAVDEPSSVPRQLRDSLLRLWRVRGGGFYGLGYVIAFVVLEVRAFVDNWAVPGADVVTVLVQEVLAFVFRFAAQSLLNGFIAFAWPIFVVKALGAIGLVLLGALAWVFDRYARPWVIARLPAPADGHDKSSQPRGAPDS